MIGFSDDTYRVASLDCTLLHKHLSYRLAQKGALIHNFENPGDAIRTFRKKSYDAILVNLISSAGSGRECRVLDEILKKAEPVVFPEGSIGIDYSEVGMYAIRRTREPDSANSKTPIIAISPIDPLGVYKNLEQRSLEAGANKYFLFANEEDDVEKCISGLIKEIVASLKQEK